MLKEPSGVMMKFNFSFFGVVVVGGGACKSPKLKPTRVEKKNSRRKKRTDGEAREEVKEVGKTGRAGGGNEGGGSESAPAVP